MARSKYYKFEFDNGELEFLTPDEAVAYCDKNKCRVTYNGARNHFETKRRNRDGFQCGYQPQLGQYVGGPREYAAILKEKGYVELGHEKPMHLEGHCNGEKVLDVELSKDLKALELSDNEIDAISSGTFRE